MAFFLLHQLTNEEVRSVISGTVKSKASEAGLRQTLKVRKESFVAGQKTAAFLVKRFHVFQSNHRKLFASTPWLVFFKVQF